MTATTEHCSALDELDRRRELAAGLGGPERVQRQHDRGLLTARERIELLCDPGSVYYFGGLAHSGIAGEEERTYGDGTILAFGEIEGRSIASSATDATIKGGSGGFGSRRRERRGSRGSSRALTCRSSTWLRAAAPGSRRSSGRASPGSVARR